MADWTALEDDSPPDGRWVQVGCWHRMPFVEFGDEWTWHIAWGFRDGTKWALPRYFREAGMKPQYWRWDMPPDPPEGDDE